MDCLPHGFENCTECAPLYAEIARLTAERDDAQAAMIDGALREAALLARAERAERVAVWSVENGATLTPPAVLSYNESGFGSCVRVLQLASDTPASILAAVEKSMGEK